MDTKPVIRTLVAALIGGAALSSAYAATDAASDPHIDPQIRPFLAELNKDSTPFWEFEGDRTRAVLTGLQAQTKVDLSGITIQEKAIEVNGRKVKLYIVKPEHARGELPVVMFIHGGVWKAGNFENHKRLVRDLVVQSNAASVFVEYTPIPDAVYPTQVEENYAATQWVEKHGKEYGIDGSRMAVAGNSVGGNMATVLAMMAKDRGGPKIRFELLLYPAAGADFTTGSYTEFATGRFLSRAFMQYGWDIYAPTAQARQNRYVVPLSATVEQLRGLPPTLIQTAENDPLRDEGEAYGRKLGEAGVSVVTTRYLGQIHDFGLLNALRTMPSTEAALRQASAAIAQSLQP
jgi:acetyl esterase/lipase